MPFEHLGEITATATSDWLTFGLLSVPLDGGFLKLKLRATEPADPTPLAKLVIHPVAAVDGGGVPPGTFYPAPIPSLLSLGPGVGETFTGEIRCRVRRYNLRWLEASVPAPVLRVTCSVWVPVGSPVPLVVGPDAMAGRSFPRMDWPAPA